MDRTQQSRYNQALLQAREGHYGQALRLLDAVVAEEPGHLAARLHRGRMYALTGQAEKAVAEFQFVLGEDGAHLEARLNLGGVYSLLGLYGDAEIHLRLAMLCSCGEEGDGLRGSAPFRSSLPDHSQN